MTGSIVVTPPPPPEGVLAVRRWARANLWAALLLLGLSLVAAAVFPSAAVDRALDVLFLATLPVLGVLELLLVVALLRLFRDQDALIAASIVVFAVGSILAALLAILFSLTGQAALEDPAMAASGVLTTAELLLMAALLRRASAEPGELWLWGLAAAAGSLLGVPAIEGPDALLILSGLLLFAFPIFLYRLGQLRLPARTAA